MKMNNKEYINMHDIVDEAYDIVDKKIDETREHPYYREKISEHYYYYLRDQMNFLKDLRDLLKMGVNFR